MRSFSNYKDQGHRILMLNCVKTVSLFPLGFVCDENCFFQYIHSTNMQSTAGCYCYIDFSKLSQHSLLVYL